MKILSQFYMTLQVQFQQKEKQQDVVKSYSKLKGNIATSPLF